MTDETKIIIGLLVTGLIVNLLLWVTLVNWLVAR